MSRPNIRGIFAILILVAIGFFFFNYWTKSTRSKNRLASIGRLSSIMMSIHYAGGIPAAFNVNEKGERLLSWRVHVLPLLGEKELYGKFNLDEAWNSPHNIELIGEMPDIYKHPTLDLKQGKTVYLGVSGKEGVFQNPLDLKEKFDSLVLPMSAIKSTSKTIALIEVNSEHAVYWSAPQDFDPAKFSDLALPVSGTWSDDVFGAATADANMIGIYSGDLKSQSSRLSYKTKSD